MFNHSTQPAEGVIVTPESFKKIEASTVSAAEALIVRVIAAQKAIEYLLRKVFSTGYSPKATDF